MTVNFGYLQYDDPIQIILVSIVTMLFVIAENCLFYLSANKQPEEIKKAYLLKVIAIVYTFFIILPFIIPRIYGSFITETEIIIYISYTVLIGLIQPLPLLITYGILLLVFGNNNKERFGKYITFAGIFWIISAGLRVGILDFNLYYLIHPPLGGILIIIANLAEFLGAFGFLFLLIHGIKNSDTFITWVGILGLISFGIRTILVLIP